ncbi:MAG TPA: carboxymuconolactone decarboxylase family protein [Opitutaceae bacterium]|nr:carboxymuconolactone decarboxylase family protein [Opitutaceae bacterium]
MSNLTALNPSSATGKTQALFNAVQSKLGVVPNVMRTLGQSPSALEAYLGFSGALAGGVLSARLREKIALAVGEQNQCEYCVTAHTSISQKVGVSTEEALAARHGQSSDPKEAAALAFARDIVEHRGRLDAQTVSKLTAQGFSEAEIVEIVANVALNLFTNYFNHIANPTIDFPRINPISA